MGEPDPQASNSGRDSSRSSGRASAGAGPANRLLGFLFAVLVLWTAAAAAIVIQRLQRADVLAERYARLEARSALNKDALYRRWAASHGGVYVPATGKTPPNPLLADIPERDLSTPSGRVLTLMNPAYMTRQVYEFAAEEGISPLGHITSLRLKRRENAPDPWEATALQAFENGAKEIVTVAPLAGEPHLRLMAPLVTEPSCLKCHAGQGYRAGDVRGGISVSVPIKPYRDFSHEEARSIALTYFAVWLAGALGILFFGAGLRRRVAERHEVEQRLSRIAREWQQTFDATSDAIAVLDPEQRIVRVNRTMARMFGLEPHEAVGRHCWEIVHGTDQPLPECPVRRMRQSLHAESMELAQGGSIFDVTVDPILDEQGRLSSAVHVIRDVTARRRTEEALRDSEARFRSIVENASAGYFFIDRDGIFRDVSRSWLEIYKYPADVDVRGRHFAEVQQLEEAANAEEFVAGILRGDPRYLAGEFSRKNFDGSVGYHSFSARPVVKSGAVIGIEGFIIDITALKQSEIALKRSNAELERFAYIASHDLQEPLRMVANFTGLLLKRYGDRLDEDGREFARYAVDGAQRLQRLITDLLTLSRLSSRALLFAPVPLDGVCEEARRNLELSASERDAEITAGPLPEVNGDRTQLVQLFQNLIGNAIKFHKPGERPRVGIAARREGRNWVVEVRDNGIGIDPAHFERIFQVFQRLHTAQQYPGTGIGLALCKRIVEHHDGTIRVDSRPGQGSTFSFTLPAIGTT